MKNHEVDFYYYYRRCIRIIYLDVCREGPRCGGGYCIPNYSVTRGYSCVCEGGVVKSEPCPFSKSKFFISFFYEIFIFIFRLSN